MQTDGNFVEYNGSTARWATNTFGPGNRVVMQTNGNLVVFNGSIPLWQSGTGGTNIELEVQNDGNVVLYQGSTAIWAITSNVTASGVSDILTEGQSKQSPGGQYLLKMQTDGNLVLYNGSTAIWATNTNTGAGNYVELGPDGNLVVFNSAHTVLWQSGTGGNSTGLAPSLDVQRDGNLVIYEPSGPIWAKTSTVSTSPVSDTLTSGQSKTSPNGQYTLAMQSGGNLVETRAGSTVWSTGTTGSGSHVAMQTDGNLVVYNAAGTALWQSHMSGKTVAAELDIQNDGNVVVYEPQGPVWSRLTGVIGGGGVGGVGASIVSYAEGEHGRPYCLDGGHSATPGPSKAAGCSATGLDCSGLVRYAVYKATGVDYLDTDADGQWAWAKANPSHSTIVSTDANGTNLQPGDIVFIKSLNKKSDPQDHTVIWVGNHAYDTDSVGWSNPKYNSPANHAVINAYGGDGLGVVYTPLNWWGDANYQIVGAYRIH
jgi:cell wall-associated NlpC family hydrolase